MSLDNLLKKYLRERPIFLSLIRAKEAELFQYCLPFKKPVLDVGCGDGFFASVTFRQVNVGLDIAQSRVGEADKLGVYKKIIIYDGNKMPFKDNHFGTIVSNCVLEHIPNLDMTIKEISRVLKPGGLFITTVASKNWEEYLFGNLILGNYYKKWMRNKQAHYNLLSNKEWQAVFKKQKLRVSKSIGYLDKKAVRWIDILHYFSFFSLVTYKIFGKWILWKSKVDNLNLGLLSRIIRRNIDPDISGNIFYVLKK